MNTNNKPTQINEHDIQHQLSIKGGGDPEKQHWNLLKEDLSLPAAIIYQSKLENNLQWMQMFAERHGVQLAPHGKTTMTPAFFSKQIEAGAWGITLASATQVAVANTNGIRRIIMANQLVGQRNMEIIAQLLSNMEFYCLVDSIDNIHQLGKFFQKAGKNLNVLIEIGVENGRCGCRNDKQAIEISQAISTYDCLKLAGVEVYEGVIHGENAEDRIEQLLVNVVTLTEQLISLDAFDYDKVILTGAGSAWYDLVSKHFHAASLKNNILPVIRPGCYLIHDTGIYQEAQNKVLCRLQSKDLKLIDLESCLEIWAYIQSIPEPGMAIVGMGKRDVAFTDGLPRPALHFRPGDETPAPANPAWLTSQVMDQHTFLKIPVDSDLKVGDMIAFSTSHPCLTFDKWKNICVINDDYEIIDHVNTAF